jgi:hypothetical protein
VRSSLPAILTLLALQFVLSIWTLPLAELFSTTPILYGDAAYHWYQTTLAANLWKSGLVAGYDPFFDAGGIAGLVGNGSARVSALLAILGMDPAIAYKVFTLASILLGPISVPLAARWFGRDRQVTWIASLLGLLLWWVSMFRWFHTIGMNGFVLIAFASLAYVAAVWKALHEGTMARMAVIGLIGGLATFAHPFFPFAVILGLIGLIAVNARTLDWWRVLRAGSTIGVIAAAITLTWLIPLGKAGMEPSLQMHVYQRIVDPKLIVLEALGQWSGDAHGAKIYTLLALLSAWACVRLKDGVVRGLTLSAALIVLYAFLAGTVEALANLEPNRFAPVAYLFLVIPAAVGALDLIGAVLMRARSAWAFAVPVAAVGAFVMYEFARELSPADGRYGKVWPEVTGEGPYTKTILRWLDEHTTTDGRVLFETSLGRIYDGARIAGYLAYKSGREFIGGPYPYRHFASAWDGELFKWDTAEYTPEMLRPYLERYNIGWSIVHSPSAKALMARLPGARKVEEFKGIELYRLGLPVGYFVEGTGKVVSRDHNRVQFADVAGERVVLRYHYVKGLVAEPNAVLRPARIGDDPTPFVEVLYPPPRFTLRIR